MSAGAELRRLQAVDTRIQALRIDIEHAQSSLRADPELERVREQAAAGERARVDAERDATAAETELNALQRRVTALDRKLYGGSVHNPHELLELQQELETLRSRASDAEERAVDLLERSERVAGEQQERVTALQQAEQRRAASLQPLQTRLGDLTHELEAATQEREGVTSSVGSDALALYTRVAQRRTPVVVQLNGDTCGGCHLPISNEERRLVRTAAGVVQCSNCDRILVP